jgi:hypothetical protein
LRLVYGIEIFRISELMRELDQTLLEAFEDIQWIFYKLAKRSKLSIFDLSKGFNASMTCLHSVPS